ncbi:ATP-binding protein [Pararhizobium polonicum]|uniref:ATP-binding protein n=1 Tax=Pararhizobium polonicum TaxID=1612624 RepID=A0A1C7P3D4_9HYPH|nr:amino acid ABC transporter ATP-binding protein [Pararhizobium polonicum]OBZ95747.1 ATP-binding protein [Pararhizobium polonicum]
MNTENHMIEIVSLKKQFGDLVVLKDINLKVTPGSVVALIGPSGSGKSTLLRCMNLLVVPDGGRVRIGSDTFTFDGTSRLPSTRQQARFRSGTGMVFQHFNLFPHMTVLQNVMEGPVSAKNMPAQQAAELARKLLAKVGLSEKVDAFPNRLSGGQKQRVAIARALAMEPAVMLFDEATSALDPELVAEVLSVMRDLAAEGMTMIIVTHEIAFARDVADTVVFMRDGIIVEEGPARDVIDNPKQEATRMFLSHFHTRAS